MLIRPIEGLHAPLPDGRTLPYIGGYEYYIAMYSYLDDYCVVVDNGEPCLVPQSRFVLMNDWNPGQWTETFDRDGDAWYGPPELKIPGFLERWHDHCEWEMVVVEKIYAELCLHYQNLYAGLRVPTVLPFDGTGKG